MHYVNFCRCLGMPSQGSVLYLPTPIFQPPTLPHYTAVSISFCRLWPYICDNTTHMAVYSRYIHTSAFMTEVRVGMPSFCASDRSCDLT